MSEMMYTNEYKCEVLERNVFEGYEYAIVSMGTHPCVYICIPEDNPFYKVDYDDITLDVHGGLTYGNEHRILNLSEDGQLTHDWWIGWDYAHLGDYSTIHHNSSGDIWTLNKLRREAKIAIEQLIKLTDEMDKDTHSSETPHDEDPPNLYDMEDIKNYKLDAKIMNFSDVIRCYSNILQQTYMLLKPMMHSNTNHIKLDQDMKGHIEGVYKMAQETYEEARRYISETPESVGDDTAQPLIFDIIGYQMSECKNAYDGINMIYENLLKNQNEQPLIKE